MAIGILASLEGEARTLSASFISLKGTVQLGIYLALFLLAEKKEKETLSAQKDFSGLKN